MEEEYLTEYPSVDEVFDEGQEFADLSFWVTRDEYQALIDFNRAFEEASRESDDVIRITTLQWVKAPKCGKRPIKELDAEVQAELHSELEAVQSDMADALNRAAAFLNCFPDVQEEELRRFILQWEIRRYILQWKNPDVMDSDKGGETV